MELTEPIADINEALVRFFSRDSDTGRPIWRVVWSEDQFEKRLMDVTDEGLQLLSPVVREVPKYRQWIKERWVLERLVIVPDQQRKELAGQMLSYEPIWVFETQGGIYLPPRFDVAKIVIDGIYAAQGKKSLKKYVDPEVGDDLEKKKARIDGIVAELFGNETPTGDALAHKTGEFFDATKQPMKLHPMITEN